MCTDRHTDIRWRSLITSATNYFLLNSEHVSGAGAGLEKIRWSGAVSGDYRGGVSGERKFPPLPLRSHVLLSHVE